jgi:hypothetical protein
MPRVSLRWILLAGVVAAAVLAVATPGAAQPPDPRLASVHVVWIEVDELSDAQPVAVCFKDRLSTQTPFTLAADRASADAVLRFAAPRPFVFELSVFLPDGTEYFAGTPLWAGGLVALNPKYVGADDRICFTATQLANQLREAMRRVRGPQ